MYGLEMENTIFKIKISLDVKTKTKTQINEFKGGSIRNKVKHTFQGSVSEWRKQIKHKRNVGLNKRSNICVNGIPGGDREEVQRNI